jgi:Photosynthetic reaction centre cytochrome C subunit
MRLLSVLLLLSAAALAQAPEGQAPQQHKQMPAPKNLKLLDPAELMPTMMAFRVALGEKCDFCHVQGDFASDEKPTKEIARKMILLARDINSKFPDGKMHVTCYTCHRGAEEPLTAPPDAAAAPKP